MEKTEFFETAVQHGFYSSKTGGLIGLDDNVRKYWEDISIKTAIRRPILRLLQIKDRLRILDLGCRSGDGYELLAHLPPVNKMTVQRDFILQDSTIKQYLGVDLSREMICKGRNNYSGKDNIEFLETNLATDFSYLTKVPFDIYFSSYGSLSHLTYTELENIFGHILYSNNEEFVIAIDLFGKFSPEWPQYWKKNDEELLEYNMNWLNSSNQQFYDKEVIHLVRFWNASEISNLFGNLAKKFVRKIEINCSDRSILVGRNMDTGFYNKFPQKLRLEVNKLFDRDYRGNVEFLSADISYLEHLKESHSLEYQRISHYCKLWNDTISFLDALIHEKHSLANEIMLSVPDFLKEELSMLKWLEGNSSRFPVVDFWASIMGPQVACVLRNLEFNLSAGMGCGHGLVCTIEVSKK